MVSLTATDLVIALKMRHSRQNIKSRGAAASLCREDRIYSRSSSAWCWWSSPSRHWCPSSRRPLGSNTRARHPRSCWTSVSTLLSELAKANLAKDHRRPEEFVCVRVCVCQSKRGETDKWGVLVGKYCMCVRSYKGIKRIIGYKVANVGV